MLALSVALTVGIPRGNAQGTIHFDTLVPGIVDTRWRLSRDDGLPFARGWIAQLMVGPVDPLPPLGSNMQAVFPTTTLCSSDDRERGYINPVVVTGPHLPPRSQAVVYVIAYPDVEPRPPFSTGVGGATIITLGGGGLPPAFLEGMPVSSASSPRPVRWPW